MAVSENVVEAIETISLKTPAIYQYNEVITTKNKLKQLLDEEQIDLKVKKCKHVRLKIRELLVAENYPLN